MSKTFDLGHIKGTEMRQFISLEQLKKWGKLLESTINRQLTEAGTGFEVISIKYLYTHYGKGGKHEGHLDITCDPLTECDTVKALPDPRLLTLTIFLNPGWQESDGGNFNTYYDWWPEEQLKEEINPTLGKAVFFRSDKLYHSEELVHTEKRALSLFINVKTISS